MLTGLISDSDWCVDLIDIAPCALVRQKMLIMYVPISGTYGYHPSIVSDTVF